MRLSHEYAQRLWKKVRICGSSEHCANENMKSGIRPVFRIANTDSRLMLFLRVNMQSKQRKKESECPETSRSSTRLARI
jgi:hypothetical protein